MQLAKTLAFALALVISSPYAEFAANRAQAAAYGGSSGDTSGPAVGTPVEPSAAVQKRNPYLQRQGKPGECDVVAGAPGIEGKTGTESGSAPGR